MAEDRTTSDGQTLVVEDSYTCPSDRVLVLKARLNSGWSFRSAQLISGMKRYESNIVGNETTPMLYGISEEELSVIRNVLGRAKQTRIQENSRITILLNSLSELKKNKLGDGITNCIICGYSFRLFAIFQYRCSDCQKLTCSSCIVKVTINSNNNNNMNLFQENIYKSSRNASMSSSTPSPPPSQTTTTTKSFNPFQSNSLTICRICNEMREMRKKSGAWFFNCDPEIIDHYLNQSTPFDETPVTKSRVENERNNLPKEKGPKFYNKLNATKSSSISESDSDESFSSSSSSYTSDSDDEVDNNHSASSEDNSKRKKETSPTHILPTSIQLAKKHSTQRRSISHSTSNSFDRGLSSVHDLEKKISHHLDHDAILSTSIGNLTRINSSIIPMNISSMNDKESEGVMLKKESFGTRRKSFVNKSVDQLEKERTCISKEKASSLSSVTSPKLSTFVNIIMKARQYRRNKIKLCKQLDDSFRETDDKQLATQRINEQMIEEEYKEMLSRNGQISLTSFLSPSDPKAFATASIDNVYSEQQTVASLESSPNSNKNSLQIFRSNNSFSYPNDNCPSPTTLTTTISRNGGNFEHPTDSNHYHKHSIAFSETLFNAKPYVSHPYRKQSDSKVNNFLSAKTNINSISKSATCLALNSENEGKRERKSSNVSLLSAYMPTVLIPKKWKENELNHRISPSKYPNNCHSNDNDSSILSSSGINSNWNSSKYSTMDGSSTAGLSAIINTSMSDRSDIRKRKSKSVKHKIIKYFTTKTGSKPEEIQSRFSIDSRKSMLQQRRDIDGKSFISDLPTPLNIIEPPELQEFNNDTLSIANRSKYTVSLPIHYTTEMNSTTNLQTSSFLTSNEPYQTTTAYSTDTGTDTRLTQSTIIDSPETLFKSNIDLSMNEMREKNSTKKRSRVKNVLYSRINYLKNRYDKERKSGNVLNAFKLI
ncbi:hypothetical protein SNEBB_006739 [Seison nebaliae]|nr:hypothetical protein SNEBB_006739 [Seison nebaliae]